MKLKTIGKNIREIRNKLGITQMQAAEKADITSVHLSHIETGNTAMSIETLLNLCKALSATPNDILMSEYEMTPNAASNMLSDIMRGLTPKEQLYIIKMAESLRDFKLNR